eukprot:COSAG06_NODE_842_length_11986_cov_54.409355_13_plen_51_part_00
MRQQKPLCVACCCMRWLLLLLPQRLLRIAQLLTNFLLKITLSRGNLQSCP